MSEWLDYNSTSFSADMAEIADDTDPSTAAGGIARRLIEDDDVATLTPAQRWVYDRELRPRLIKLYERRDAAHRKELWDRAG